MGKKTYRTRVRRCMLAQTLQLCRNPKALIAIMWMKHTEIQSTAMLVYSIM